MGHESKSIVTHTEKRENGQDRQLDYIACSDQYHIARDQAHTSEHWTHSDHLALITTLEPPETSQQPPTKIANRQEVIKHLENKEIKQIINHPDWPRRPWIVIARTLGYTKMVQKDASSIIAFNKLIHKPQLTRTTTVLTKDEAMTHMRTIKSKANLETDRLQVA